MTLVDTSAWVEFTRGTGSAVHLRLRDLIASSDLVATTQPVLMEVMAGARSEAHAERHRRLLVRADTLAFDPDVDFDAASRIYRLCRRAGVTPRSLIDCAVAAVAMRFNAVVLANDVDFARIATVVPLQLDPATPTD